MRVTMAVNKANEIEQGSLRPPTNFAWEMAKRLKQNPDTWLRHLVNQC